jgi:hypothetical protein
MTEGDVLRLGAEDERVSCVHTTPTRTPHHCFRATASGLQQCSFRICQFRYAWAALVLPTYFRASVFEDAPIQEQTTEHQPRRQYGLPVCSYVII